jgi:pyrroline-5-carboxylate reductase
VRFIAEPQHRKPQLNDVLTETNISILGTGNIGGAIATGLLKSGRFQAENITLTRRRVHLLDGLKEQGFNVERDNLKAVRNSRIIIIAVEPQQVNRVLSEISAALLPERHILISVVTGVSTQHIIRQIEDGITVIRAMPNTAIAVGESMTCIASDGSDGQAVDAARAIFDTVGKTVILDEEEMIAATALGACGIAFFLRAIRAASQGGIEIGFQSSDALAIAAQTARGAATLVLDSKNHPEHEIDRVTTPKGCTIAGLNRMEHEGFSSAMIRGITVSAERATNLYTPTGRED